MKTHVVPFLRSTYNYDMNRAGDESGLKCEDPTKTQQHQAEETDINNIVNRYLKTGELPNRTIPPMQGDFTNAPNMQEAMDLVVRARVAFMEQPAEVRSRFENDPVKFVNFCSDEKNRDEMRKMGMWSPEANAAFKAEAEAKASEAEANKRDAEEHRRSRKETPKGVT